LIETALELRRLRANLRFEVAAASPDLAKQMEKMLFPEDRQLFEIKIGRTAEIMQRAFAGVVASGSATLEAAYFRMPFALIYKVAWPTYFAGRLVVKVKYLGMPNVLAEKEVVPEFIQHRAKPHDLSNAVLQLLDDSKTRQEMIFEFDKIATQLGEAGASARAAKAILAEILVIE
jgi:lipid-A-disaccharide synthase